MPSTLIDVIRRHAPAPASGAGLAADGEKHGLLAALAQVPDPRHRRGIRYPLASMLAVAVCAVLAGATTFTAISDVACDLDRAAWTRLGFTGRIPVLTTVWRLLVRLDAERLQAVLADWLLLVNSSSFGRPCSVRWAIARTGRGRRHVRAMAAGATEAGGRASRTPPRRPGCRPGTSSSRS
jgi:hypothetical protein